MKQLTCIAFIVIATFTKAQTNFEKGMTSAFELWETNKIDEAANLFERIANAEKDNWLPHYYIAQINSIKSWNEKDATVLKSQLDKAQEHLGIAMRLSKNNPEISVMQAQIYTNWIAFDGMTYGMKYSAKVSELYAKAFELDPKNPRVAACKAEWDMGSAKYFGKDTAPYCKDIEASLELFDNYKPMSKLHPTWGKNRAEQEVIDCKA